MADQFAGAQKIGSLLFGGAKRIRSEAYEEGRLNTAKTEDALANARLNQMKATAASNAERAKEKWKADYIAIESTKPGADPKEVASRAEFIGNMIIGGTGSDYHNIMQGQGEQQDINLRDTLADPDAPRETAHAAGSAIQGKLLPRIAPVGTHGTENLLDEEPTLTIPPGGGNLSTHAKDYNFREQLSRENPSGVPTFDSIVRADRVFTAGGVPMSVPGVNPDGRGPRELVSAEDVAGNKEVTADAAKTGQERAKLRAAYPTAKFARDRTQQDITAMNDQAMEIAKNEKTWQAFGLTRPIAAIPGTEGANIRALVQTLQSKLMLNTLLNLRAMSKTGGAVGNVSDREGLKMETAIANLSDPNITVGQVLKEVKKLIGYNVELSGYIDEAFDLTYDEKGEPRVARPSPAAAGGEGEGDVAVDGEQTSIEDEIINRGDGEYNDEGFLVDSRGWVFEKSPDGAAWVNPNDRTQFDEVAQ